MATQSRFPVLRTVVAAALCAIAVQAYSNPSQPPAPANPPEGLVVSGAPRPSFRSQGFANLVGDRVRAIELAFGETFAPAAKQLRIVLVSSEAAARSGMSEIAAYEPESHTLYFARRLQFAVTPPRSFATQQYWPWHEEPLRSEFPLIETIDSILWTALLQEFARGRNLNWPHAECGSLEIAERLPCEMLVQGVAAHTARARGPVFNENRTAEIWPENLEEFRRNAWRRDHPAYQNVRNYGGYLLLRPLVAEFGLVRTLNYVASTPFRVEDNNVRLSAQAYQRRAEEALAW